MRTKERLRADNTPRLKKISLDENEPVEIPKHIDHGKVMVKVSDTPPTWKMMTPERKEQFLKDKLLTHLKQHDMWNTSYKHNNETVVEMTHHFGNGVTVVTDFETNTSKLKHGDITVSEHEVSKEIGNYYHYLNNVDKEVNPEVINPENEPENE